MLSHLILAILLAVRVEIANESPCTLTVRAMQSDRIVRSTMLRPAARATYTLVESAGVRFVVDGPGCGYDRHELPRPRATNPGTIELTLREEPSRSVVRG